MCCYSNHTFGTGILRLISLWEVTLKECDLVSYAMFYMVMGLYAGCTGALKRLTFLSNRYNSFINVETYCFCVAKTQ